MSSATELDLTTGRLQPENVRDYSMTGNGASLSDLPSGLSAPHGYFPFNSTNHRVEPSTWAARIRRQGPWNPQTDPVSLHGPLALPMPVKVSDAESLAPFFEHLAADGTFEADSAMPGAPAEATEEKFYATKALEFPKGVLYEDQRMDLCKMVLGPPNITDLLQSLKGNRFVKHFLLGNNIIGPTGALAIADFIKEYPDRIDTWYLAGNCVDAESFAELVDAMILSTAVTNIWLKRNPLGPSAAKSLHRLITQTPNLRTLDLDQTALGDTGASELFSLLASGSPPPLKILYTSGNGLSTNAAMHVGQYLQHPQCQLHSLYLANNPLGNAGVTMLALGLASNTSVTRLCLRSVGMGDAGAAKLFLAFARSNASLRLLDIAESIATEDLGQRYNYITDEVVIPLIEMIRTLPKLEYLDLGNCALSSIGLIDVVATCLESKTLLYFSAKSVLEAGAGGDVEEKAAAKDLRRLESQLQYRLAENVKAKYGAEVTYSGFLQREKRWLVSDERDVRKIDSVYRNRDMGLARRGLKKLDKWWVGDEDEWKDIVGPVCTMRRNARLGES
jgi:NLR family CARD domain-containing protein 3